jgi:hypothetical protein
MKKRLNFIVSQLSVLILVVASVQVFAQKPCSADLHAVFGNSSKDTPVLLKRLGTSPQFGEIPRHTAAAAYSHLKIVHSKNIHQSRTEIDDYLKALGYTGFLDKEFNASKITPEILKAGRVGWMGAYAKGHKYKWSVLGKDFETFRIASKDGSCYAYVMKKCGNAFYDPTNREAEEAAALAAFKAAQQPKATCLTQTINFAGKGKLQAGDVVNTTQSLPIVATYNGKTLCIGEQTVPVRLTYDMTASGEVNYAKTVQVCDYNGMPASTTVNLPLVMKYNLAATDVTIGEDGRMNMALNSKQYKSLSKVYKACPSNVANSPSNKTLAANKVSNASTASPATESGATGNGNNCVKQTLNLSGSATTEDVSSKSSTNEVTVIGVYNKLGKLQKGETAKKYMCLGSYNVPAKSALQYSLTGNSNLSHPIEVCDNGNVNPNETISVPMKLTQSFTKQETMIGDYGKIYMPLTKSQYKKLGKVFKRCCSDGSSKSKCY